MWLQVMTAGWSPENTGWSPTWASPKMQGHRLKMQGCRLKTEDGPVEETGCSEMRTHEEFGRCQPPPAGRAHRVSSVS